MTIKKRNPQKISPTDSATRSIRLLPRRKTVGATSSVKDITVSQVEGVEQFPIVGIGASAGGLAAFEAFFSGMPPVTDPNMAFVLVQHLAPDHKSILTGLIQRYTRMQVSEVEDGMEVRPNCAYIIPPGRDMAFLNGSLQLLEPSAPRGQRLPIDFFFSSLARDQREKAICIVLSGTGSDGTQGVRAIKGEGGMAMAQSPSSTEYDGMPKSAIATGLIDYELPPAEMAVQLMAYAACVFTGPAKYFHPLLPKEDENTMQTIFNVLRKETGHDFSQYKASTIHRRLERRMAVHQIERIDDYVKYLQQTPVEVKALFSDLLIGVTSFFRDPAPFKDLEKKIIPKLFADRSVGDTVRVWSQGCSTGEEAYSLAILLQEHLNKLKQSYTVQVFATDIDSKAIATARAGLYPASIAADISPDRLERYFSIEPNNTTYRIHKGIRDMVIFSEQDVVKDPPFSKLDLISCRNLLIYMTSSLQKKVILLFHYALKPGGFLFLGSSETAGECGDIFEVFDKKSKLYRRRQGMNDVYRTHLGHIFPITVAENYAQSLPAWKKAGLGRLSFRELTEQALLQQIAPTGILVNGRGDILYLHGRTGMYLEPNPGVTVNNILEMAREGLQHELAGALQKTSASQVTSHRYGLRVSSNGALISVNLTISPLITGPARSNDAPLYLVMLDEVVSAHNDISADADGSSPSLELEASVYIATLRLELRVKEKFLQTANEELKSYIEEMQSINEELQSTNEELQTSKEELQSTNEELATVNAELQNNVTDLTRVNNDMNNMVAGTGIGTVFVDHDLRILRFTPDVTGIINLINTDVGRPIGHIVCNLAENDHLVADVQVVLDTLAPQQKDVQTIEGLWYAMRIHPYLTMDNVIEGAVISFIDITERKRVEDALQKSFDEIRTLRGIVPICANCKQIRDDKGFWSQVEDYVRDHTEAEFSHGICPECAKQLYPEFEEPGSESTVDPL